jgi:cobaltochelatase CobT
MTTDSDNPLEPFKRAMTATMRAIAADDELDVTFGPGVATSSGNRVRVPLPNIGSTEQEVNAVRGVGDEIALRLRYHDERVHRSRSPRSGPAEEMFRWVEDACTPSARCAWRVAQSRAVSASAKAFDTITTIQALLSITVGLLAKKH